MSSMQVVFLFDLNACANFLFSPKEELSRILLSVRLACLRLLSNFSSKHTNLKWGAKFFDSQGSKNQTMDKFVFTDLSLENFETLENEICIRYERHLSILRVLKESAHNNLLPVTCAGDDASVGLPIKILQLALTQVLCEFQWETMDMWSPSYTKIKKRKRNYLFVLSDFKDSDESFQKIFGLSHSLSKPKFMNIFLPQSLRDSILKKADIHLVLLNMSEDQNFMGRFSSKFLPLLSDTLQSVHGSFIPLCILSQPLCDLKFSNELERNFCKEKELLSSLPAGYQNSFLAFSTLFEQSLHHPFYSSANTLMYECCIDFTSKHIQIPIQIMEISNKDPDAYEDVSGKIIGLQNNKCASNSSWLKFNVCFAVPRGAYFPASKVLLCMSRFCESDSSYTCGLQKLNNYLSVEGFSLFLECVTEDGRKLPGFLNPLSCDSAVVSVFEPATALKLGCKFPDSSLPKNQNFESNFLDEIQNICDKNMGLFDNVVNSRVIPKPFQFQCLENKFIPQKLDSLASCTLIDSLKMKNYSSLLLQSVKKNRSSKSKQIKKLSTDEPQSHVIDQTKITDEKLQDTLTNCETQMNFLEELPNDISYEELILAVREAYESAIASESINAITASKAIMRKIVTHCKKQNETSYKEHVNMILKDNILVKGQRCITQKYDSLDSKEAAEKIIKECQIQILLNLEMESLEKNPDKSSCTNIITSLMRTAEFYFMCRETLQLDGLKERKSFLNDVLKKNYGDDLRDILEECIQEFEDSESSVGSPAETISSEYNNEDELFSSMISSNLSEKSSSSTSSCKINNKDAKTKDTLERKLLRRRSDISDTARYRQVLLPKSSPKKKKTKVVGNKALRYSPRLAAKKNEHNKSACEKTNKARRNLFSGEKAGRTPKKYVNPSTPKSKKKNVALKTKLAAETPAHKQDYSTLQRRKSFMDESNSPKIIAESPTIRKTAKDDANKELLEKLLKPRQPSNTDVEQKQRQPSLKDFTPESKRRLSLKLFSKLLNSPTARQGIKKCTKRLFDQVSPLKNVENCKRFKASNEFEQSSNLFLKNETQS